MLSINKEIIVLLFFTFIIWSFYVYSSIRTDHIALCLISLYLLSMKNISKKIIVAIIPLILFYCTILLSTLYEFFLKNTDMTRLSPILDSFEWYLRGAIIFTFICSLGPLRMEVIYKLGKVFVFSSIPIGLFALLQALNINIIYEFLSIYYPSNVSPYQYIGGQRYSSILTQPVSYGMFFFTSLALLLFLQDNIIQNNIVRIIIFIIILFLSFLSVSKFIFLGIPLMILFYFIFFKLKALKFLLLLFIFSMSTVLLLFLSDFFNYINYDLTHFFNNYSGFTNIFNIAYDAFTVRLSNTGAQSKDLELFLTNPIIGIGWGDYNPRLNDSGFLPILVLSGMIGFIFYILYLLFISLSSIYYLNTIKNRYYGIYAFYITLFVIFFIFSIGSSPFYMDRIGDFYWVVSAIVFSNKIYKGEVN